MLKLFSKTDLPIINKVETLIGANTSFSGHLRCDGNIRIDGVCEEGIIETLGNVVVTPNARVAAKIIAHHVSVAGEVSGAIQAHGFLEIIGSGQVSGNVQVANFHKDETATLSGELEMTTNHS